AVFALLLGIIAGLASAGFLAKRGHPHAGNARYMALGISLLAARAAYVAGWWPQYAQQPVTILNIRDGGFDLIVAVGVLIVATIVIGWRRPALRKALAVSASVGILAWAFGGLVARSLIRSASRPLPTLTLNDLDGREVALSEFRGQPTVINLWATWCGPCRREMPVLAEAQRTMPQVRFVFADQGESAAAVKSYMQAQRLTLEHVLIDANLDLSNYYSARGYPTTLFLDASGQLRDTHIGELSRATLAERLQRIQTPVSVTPP
ncbi:MAG: redoxin domain-containing protein, partial [Rhodanobacter sp.]